MSDWDRFDEQDDASKRDGHRVTLQVDEATASASIR
jgi:hypothetical protein